MLEPVSEEVDVVPPTSDVTAPVSVPLPGPAPFKRKLSDDQIAEIRQSADANKVLAERYGVSVPTIARYRK